MNRYVIGIDTGGTFTDGVLLHYGTRKVVSTAKSLTTRDDLKKGVIKVLKKLEIKEDYNIKLVGISSTLATNSIAEGKARKVGLILIGYDQDLVESYGLIDKMSTQEIAFFQGGHNAQGAEAAALDVEGIQKWVNEKKDDVDAIAISSYFSPLNSDHEEAAFKIVQNCSDLPVVMAHQLSTKLDSIKRAATASINASLVAVMQDFIQAVQYSLKDLDIESPLMIVRGDGTLMPYTEAVKKPVETVLSGPAASAIGGRFLSENGSSLVIDIGSTTTDMALVKDSRVVISEEGAKVGETETAVEAAKIRTISVGCDSRIGYNEKKELSIGPDRVRALSQMAFHHEHVAEEIQNLNKGTFVKKNPYDVEYWYLHRPLEEEIFNSLSDKQKKVIELIQKPVRLSDLMRKVGVFHPTHLNMQDFIQQGKIECASLNPSDLLHVERAMDLWDRETAKAATDYYCNIYGKNRKEFIEGVFNKVIDMIVEEIILFLACQNINPSKMPGSIDGVWGKWMLHEILYSDNNFLSINADSRYPIIGTGAPAKHFLKKSAKLVNTKFVLPEFANVANAVGAVSGSVTEVREAIVFIQESQEQYTYVVKFEGKQKNFEEYQDACDYAEEKSRRLAREAAINAGATDPFIEVERKKEGSLTRYEARAIGNPKLSDRQDLEEE